MDTQNSGLKIKNHTSHSPQETFDLAGEFGETLKGGEVVLLTGNLGAGKTLFTKGILYALDYDIDEVTSPSFTLVNLYKTDRGDVYHLDFWRLEEGSYIARAVGLEEIVDDEKTIIIIEWAEKLGNFSFPGTVFEIKIEGAGDEPRRIEIVSG